MLAPVRASLAENKPIHWQRVNALPGYVYFDHSIHIAKGVGCTTCHGPIGQMKLTRQAAPLTMHWCLDCHRDPAKAAAPARSGVRSRLEAVRRPAKPRHASWSPPIISTPITSRIARYVTDERAARQGIAVLSASRPRRAQSAPGAEPARVRHRDGTCCLQQTGRADHSLCQNAGARGPGRTAEIRDNAAAFRVRTRSHRHFDRRAPDQGRGQSAASGKPRGDRRLCRSRGLVAVRSRPIAHHPQQRRDRFARRVRAGAAGTTAADARSATAKAFGCSRGV